MPSSDITAALINVIKHEEQAYEHAGDRWIKANQECREANDEMEGAEKRTLGACQALISLEAPIHDEAIKARCKDVIARRGM
jgi:hypothetical protein